MATMREVATTALRKMRVIASGETPSAEEMNDALQAFRSLYEAWVSGGMFGRLSNKIATEAVIAGENERIQVRTGGSVSLPDLIDDEFDEGRAPRNRAVVVVADVLAGTTETHLYDANRAGWVALSGLGLDDSAPLSDRDADGLACCLAEALVEEYGADLGPITLRRAASFRSALANSYDDPAGSSELVYF